MTRAYLGESGIVLLAGDEKPLFDADGVRWQWNGDEPWTPGSAPRTVTGENATDHGSWDATRFYQARTYEVKGTAHVPSHEGMHRAKRRFMAACGLAPFDLRVIEPGFDRFGSFRRDGQPLWAETLLRPDGSGTAKFSVPLWARDPRAYSTALHTASTTFPASTGGMSWPASWPTTWDAVSSGGEMALMNAGLSDDVHAWPTYRLDGPPSGQLVDPVIVNADTDQAMRFAITLGPGEWLTVDTGTHEVLGNGDPNASRRNTFHGDWFGLAPGSNTVRFTGASGAGSTLSASWRDTDI